MHRSTPDGGRRWNNRAVVHEVDRYRARWLWGLLGGMVLAAMPYAAYLLMQNECLKLSYEINDLRSQRDRLAEQQRRLDVEQATLESLSAVETWAIESHGLVRSERERVIVVRRAKTPTEAAPASYSMP